MNDSRSAGFITLHPSRSVRQLVAIGRSRHVEWIDHAGDERVVVRRRGELDQPLLAVTLFERVEGRLVHPVRAHELPDVIDDVPLFGGQFAGIAFGTEHVYHFFANAVALGSPHLRRPDISGFALPYRREDSDRAQLRIDDIIVTKEGGERKEPLRQFWTV